MQKVWLTVNGTNLRAQSAFRHAGFEEEGRLKRHIWLDGAYDDLVYMSAFREDARPLEPETGDPGEDPPETEEGAAGDPAA